MRLGLFFSGFSLSDEERSLIYSLSMEYRSWEKGLSKEEMYLIRKYTFNSYDDHKPNRFFERLNRALRGDYSRPDRAKLLAYGQTISKAICKHPISQQIVCYRGVDNDLTKNLVVGTKFTFNQFVSTSVLERGALKKRFKYVIVVPEGANGAYIENISAFKGQYEFLLDYKCEFKIIAKSGRTIYLEVVV